MRKGNEMDTVLKVILGILILIVLLYVGGIVLHILGAVISFVLQIIVGALAILLIIWLINRLMRGSRT